MSTATESTAAYLYQQAQGVIGIAPFPVKGECRREHYYTVHSNGLLELLGGQNQGC